ncbi:hypothetical protein KKC13_02650 [bacterium]|nr:hypothetical protein [bacterium]MBU1957143.1 hypothetical protein [bacterium]
MKNIILLILFVAAIFLVTYYYKQSSLTLIDQGVRLKVKEKRVLLNYKVKEKDSIVFSNVNIEQSTLLKEPYQAYFEVARAEPLYEFSQKTEELVRILFEAKSSETIFSINGLRAMQVTLNDNQVINLFVSDTDTKELHLFYGISNELFASTIKKLSGIVSAKLDLKDAVDLNKSITKWSVKHNDIDGIISSIDY